MTIYTIYIQYIYTVYVIVYILTYLHLDLRTEWVLRVGNVDGIGDYCACSYRSDAPPGGGYIVREELLPAYIT